MLYKNLEFLFKKIKYTVVIITFLFTGIVLLQSCTNSEEGKKYSEDSLDRTVLPIKEPIPPTTSELDARKITPPKRFEVTAPKGAPNVLIIIIDDMGFGVPSTFGGPAHMPSADKLAETGLVYNNFHTTALCAPTRTALLSGRNHHMNNMGSVTETATAYPGNTGQRPNYIAPLASILRYNGYSTAHFGKNHETAAWEVSPSGPTDRWPIRNGFDKFYGFYGGETNMWAPTIYDGMSPVEVPDDPNYNFMTDMTDKAIEWVNFQQALTPDKPFFLYFATGATHAPHNPPQSYIDKYKGKFNQGWDKMRGETLERQIRLGIVPEGTKLAPKPSFIKDWETLSADEKKMFARQMEVFAAYSEYADVEIGRLIDNIKEIGELDNTLIIYILGDNGTSAEGGTNGAFNELSALNGIPETVKDQLKMYDEWGGPMTYPHMASGWAIASDAPFSYAKQVASDFGGTRNGMIIRWSKMFNSKGEVRDQFSHVIDIVPTILEATGLPEPKIVDGIEQVPIQGTSLVYTFTDANAISRHTSQYFEMGGNRAMYHEGWFARVLHREPWERQPKRPLEEDVWELYNTAEDFSLANDVAKQYPEKLKELQDLFMKEASKNYVLPLDDRSYERLNAALVGRPDLMAGRTSLTLRSGMRDLSENAFINVKNKSHTITAQVEAPNGGANGVILAQGGRFGGWSLYIKDGKPSFTYNFVGLQRTTIASAKTLPVGKFIIKLTFAYDGGGIGKGGLYTLFVNDKEVAKGRVEHTIPMLYSLDETADVGIDGATPVVENYGSPKGKFNGKIIKVTVDISDTGTP
jgi:arylsulfatase